MGLLSSTIALLGTSEANPSHHEHYYRALLYRSKSSRTYTCSLLSPLTNFSVPLACKVAATSCVILLEPSAVNSAKMIATPLKAMVDRNTVWYASAVAPLYAAVPTARMVSFRPGTSSNEPVAYAPRKSGTEDSGRPAATRAGGTWLGMV